MLRKTTVAHARPFGAWAPSKTLEELKARSPRPTDFKMRWSFLGRSQVYYNPALMAHYKDPQHFKDCLHKIIAQSTDRVHFFGNGLKHPSGYEAKQLVAMGLVIFFSLSVTQWLYGSYLPQNNSRWRKMMNKEWEEAINNSPWDHRTHVWLYCDVYSATLGDITSLGRKKFYIPS